MTEPTPTKPWILPGRDPSSRPPVQVGEAWYDADSWDEIQRIQALLPRSAQGGISDHDLMCSMGMTADRLLDHLGMSADEIFEQFGEPREELADSLGLPTEAEVLTFLEQYTEQHAVSD
ncbi:MAG: hypothetical protein F4188_00960 [Chloroflexi bacterium]|nr:hypothetical protein [Chloroflexota bacterium]